MISSNALIAGVVAAGGLRWGARHSLEHPPAKRRTFDLLLPARAAAHFSPQAEADPAALVVSQLQGESRNLREPAGLVQADAESGFRRHGASHQSPQHFCGP